jgi:DNA (cytosine-5)-methyltransferase 1
MTLTYGSLFSGVGMMDLGLDESGWHPLWSCEIDPVCRSVLKRHRPGVKVYEDVRTILDERPAIPTLLVGGTPCQDLSVAGKRRGLAGERSGLFYDFVRVADALAPRWLLWENVGGALSSPPGRKGEDFAIVLKEITGFWPAVPSDGWRSSGICVGTKRAAAWRLLDSQYNRVAQRRRRVFIVAISGNTSGLDEQESWEHICGLAGLPAAVLFEQTSVSWDTAPSRETESRIASTLRSRSHSRGVSMPGRGGEDDQNIVIARSLMAKGNDPQDPSIENSIVATLNTSGNNGGFRSEPGEHLVCGTLQLHSKAHGHAMTSQQAAENNQLIPYNGVRRLTPTECEILMGLPLDWTKYGHDGKKISNSARYRMIGNGCVVNEIEWIGRRIIEANKTAEANGNL